MVVFFSVFIIAASWLLCSYVLGGVFRYSIKNNLITTYNSCNELFQDESGDLFENGDLFGQIKNPQDAVVMIVDSDNGKLYTSINDEGQMMEGMRSLMNSIRSEDNESQFGTGEYIIRRNHDTITNADYYDLIGRLNNGYEVLLRTPIARVESVMQVMTHLFIYICIGLMVFGTSFMLLFSNIFAAPIKRMSKAAKRMSELDFDVKIPVTSNDEIGELGNSMNEMSEKLEQTISELKAANIELQRDIAERRKIDDMRKEFLSHVSHELKTPIALIQGYAEGLQEGVNDDPESRQFYCDVIVDEAAKMNNMVKKLLTLNQLEAGNDVVSMERFDITALVHNYLQSADLLAKQNGISVHMDQTKEIYVWGDEFKIEEVLMNYFSNAVNHCEKEKVVEVKIEEMDGHARVSVFNTGMPIPEDSLPHLWEKFYKVDKARTREYGGSGIGLSIVKAIMESMNQKYGVINYENGVRFWFELELAGEESEITPAISEKNS